MATWEKVKFYWQTMLGSSGSTLSATSTLSGTDVNNIYNMLEGNRWEATDTTSPQYLTYDAGAGNTATADYIASIGHNFFSAGAELSLEASNDNFTTTEVMDAYIPTADTVELRELTYLVNPDYEVWGGALPDGWAEEAGATISQETTIIKSGTSAIKAIVAAAGKLLLVQYPDLKTGITFWQGKTISLGAWVYASAASVARISIFDGAGESSSSFHSGGGSWEFLTVTRTINSGATTLRISPLKTSTIAGGATVYGDKCILKIGSSVLPTDANEPFDVANQTGFRYWRRKIGGTLTVAPKAAISIWGNKTELDYARASFDPNAEEIKANVNISDTGYLLGIHRRFIERSMSLSFPDSDQAFYDTVKAWWDGNGLNNFFVAWEHANNPSDVFLMHPDPKFSAPLTNGGAYRDVTIKLKGRKE